jgi:REP element-mobilizing transposase RayT
MLFHAWFSTKYRRHTLVGETAKRAKDLLWECVRRHRYDVVDLSANGDHVHILLRASDRCELAAIMRTLKCVSSKELLKTLRGADLRATVRAFWARRYDCRQIQDDELNSVQQYVREQES